MVIIVKSDRKGPSELDLRGVRRQFDRLDN
jgi:hypothetical protein